MVAGNANVLWRSGGRVVRAVCRSLLVYSSRAESGGICRASLILPLGEIVLDEVI